MYKNIDDTAIMEACEDSGIADFISQKKVNSQYSRLRLHELIRYNRHKYHMQAMK